MKKKYVSNKIISVLIIFAFIFCILSIIAICFTAYYGNDLKHLFKIALPILIMLILWQTQRKFGN